MTNPPWRPGWFRSPTAVTAAGRSGSRRPAAVRGAGAARVPDRGRGDRGRLAGRVSSFPAFSGGGPTAPDPRRGGRRRHPRVPARQPRRRRLRRRRGERHGGGPAGDRAAPAVAGRARPRPRGRQRPGVARPGARGGRPGLPHRPRPAGGRPERPGGGRRPGALASRAGPTIISASRSCTPSCSPGCGRCCGEPRDGARAGSCASATSPWTPPRARCGWRVAASSWRRRSSRCCTRSRQHPTRVYRKQELLRDVWGYLSPGNTRTLDAHACRLRKKLHPSGRRWVVNVRGRRLQADGGRVSWAVGALLGGLVAGAGGGCWTLRRRMRSPGGRGARAARGGHGDRRCWPSGRRRCGSSSTALSAGLADLLGASRRARRGAARGPRGGPAGAGAGQRGGQRGRARAGPGGGASAPRGRGGVAGGGECGCGATRAARGGRWRDRLRRADASLPLAPIAGAVSGSLGVRPEAGRAAERGARGRRHARGRRVARRGGGRHRAPRGMTPTRRRGLLLVCFALVCGGLAASQVRERERRAEAAVGPLVSVVVAASRSARRAAPGLGGPLGQAGPGPLPAARRAAGRGRLEGARTAVAVPAGGYLTAGALGGGAPARGPRPLRARRAGAGARRGGRRASRARTRARAWTCSSRARVARARGRTFVALEDAELLALRPASGGRGGGAGAGGGRRRRRGRPAPSPRCASPRIRPST